MEKCKSPPTIAPGVAMEGTCSGSTSDEEVVVVSPIEFSLIPTRP